MYPLPPFDGMRPWFRRRRSLAGSGPGGGAGVICCAPPGSKQSALKQLIVAAAVWMALLVPAGHPLAAESSPEELSPEQLVANIEELKRRLARLDTDTSDLSGLNQRIAHRRIEKVWREIAESAHALARNLAAAQQQDGSPAGYEAAVVPLLEQIDAAIRVSVGRIRAELLTLSPDESAMSPAELANVYYRRHMLYQRVADLFDAYAQNLDWMASYELPAEQVADARAWFSDIAQFAAEVISLSLDVAAEDVARLTEQQRILPDDAQITALRSVAQSRLTSLATDLDEVVDVLGAQGFDVSAYRGQIVLSTHQISDQLLDSELIGQLSGRAMVAVRAWLGSTAPGLMVKLLTILLILLLTAGIARLLGHLAESATTSPRFRGSQLLRDLISRSARRVVWIMGILVALSQVGVSVGPLLAGLGVAGFVIGFALQDTLSNFASGALILLYRPFDVGDTIESGDVFGVVRDMSLVNTTVLTFDNQTLVVPNSKIWGGVIRNVTAQINRRVDLVFGISYQDDIAKAERILSEVVSAHDKVLHEPAPVVRLHELGDSSVNFIVRPWVRRDDYWDVYWDLTRAVKLRFDAEGVSIPFPHREVILRGPGSGVVNGGAALQADTASDSRAGQSFPSVADDDD